MSDFNFKELRSKSDVELRTSLLNLKRESMNLRFQKHSGQLDKTSRIREVRKSIARVITALNQINVKGGGCA